MGIYVRLKARVNNDQERRAVAGLVLGEEVAPDTFVVRFGGHGEGFDEAVSLSDNLLSHAVAFDAKGVAIILDYEEAEGLLSLSSEEALKALLVLAQAKDPGAFVVPFEWLDSDGEESSEGGEA